jgi:hypothetical protein
MKKIVTILMSFVALSAVAQPISDLVVYTTEPDPFYLILNGIKQNDEPMTNVRVTDLNQPVYDARILFESGTIRIDKKIYFAEPGMEYVYKVKEKKNGELTLRIQSATAFNLAPPPPAGQRVVVYHATPNQLPPARTVTTTTSTSTSTTTMQNGGTNIGINMGINVPGINMNVNIQEPMNVGGAVTYTESVTTTSGSVIEPSAPSHYIMPGYGGAIGCPWPMEEGQFSDAMNSVSSTSFDDDKFTIAKQITGSNCLTANQVRRMMGQLDFEDTKLQYAKFAYNKTYDIGNYYKLNDAFDFSSSIDELNAYINRN